MARREPYTSSHQPRRCSGAFQMLPSRCGPCFCNVRREDPRLRHNRWRPHGFAGPHRAPRSSRRRTESIPARANEEPIRSGDPAAIAKIKDKIEALALPIFKANAIIRRRKFPIAVIILDRQTATHG